MQIVIDVPEKVYNRFCRCCRFPDEVEEAIIAITDGTPLPKGHGRLIDTDVLVDGMEDDYEFCEAVNATPTIIKADKEDDDAGGKM